MRLRLPHILLRVVLAALPASCDDGADVSLPAPPPTRAPDLASSAAPAKPAVSTQAPGSLDSAAPQASGEAGAAEPRGAADSGPAPHVSLFVRSSRCGECHEKLFLDWGQSAHSHASRSPAYRKGLAAAGAALTGLCQSCHLPSMAYGQLDDQPGRPSEGVACDGCHTISAVTVGKTEASIKFDPGSGKKYGPIVGATGHYFHDMAYSLLHTKSETCAGCHHLTAFKAGGQTLNIPVVSSYSDWKLYGKGKQCQDCHMPSRGTEPVAKGAKPRPNVPAHIFADTARLGTQIRFELLPKSKPGEITVALQHSAGHMLPSGFVERRIIVRAEFFDHGGAKVATLDRSYGIKLVDSTGQPAPFFRAARIAEDRRMAPGRQYTESFAVPAVPALPSPAAPSVATRVTLSLLAAPTAPELSAVYGEPELTVLKSTSLTLPSRPGGR